MNSDEYYTYEDRAYVSPTLSRDEQMSFVDNLRDTVGDNTAQINAQTQALGTNVPSNLGGLTGSNGYFAQRYQTTPVEAQVKNLKATAQAKALSDLMTNYQTQAQNRYNQAYRAYNKRSGGGTGSGTGSNGSNTLDNNTSGWNGEIDENPTNSPIQYTYAYKVPYKDPVKVFINNDASADESARILSRLGQGSDGRLETVDGVQYVWSNYGKYGPTWYRVLF